MSGGAGSSSAIESSRGSGGRERERYVCLWWVKRKPTGGAHGRKVTMVGATETVAEGALVRL